MLYDKLKNYSDNGIYPFHMPGHKRNFGNQLPYNIDLTEIEGFDNLHNAEGCIKDIEDKASKLYSVNRAFLLVNGATGGILSAIRALTDYGDKVIVARNCHKSVYNAIEICGLNPIYVLPEYSESYGIYTEMKADSIEKLLFENPDTKLVIITSPTYEGIVSDISEISKICKKYSTKLFVDEAHGAHFPFSDNFPDEAVKCGADVAVTSLHKTLPSLTQTGLLLTNDLSLENKIQQNLSVFETSSPSYILMSSIEKCLEYISENPDIFIDYYINLKDFYEKSKLLKNIKVLSFKNFDIGKIIIHTANTDINGIELAKILREKYLIETEMAYTNYVLAMTSVCDTKEGFLRLLEALVEIDKTCTVSQLDMSYSVLASIPKRVFTSSEKSKFKSKIIDFKSSNNRVSMEYVWAYPPGIPLIVPGEVISDEIISTINNLSEKNIEIYSSEKNLPHCISVAEID